MVIVASQFFFRGFPLRSLCVYSATDSTIALFRCIQTTANCGKTSIGSKRTTRLLKMPAEKRLVQTETQIISRCPSRSPPMHQLFLASALAHHSRYRRCIGTISPWDSIVFLAEKCVANISHPSNRSLVNPPTAKDSSIPGLYS